KILHHIYNTNNTIVSKLSQGSKLTKHQYNDLFNLPSTYLICYLNGFEGAIEKLQEAKSYLNNFNPEILSLYKEAMRILRKVKYS
ncbi:MAG: DUF5929 domain-containing protein, partial [Flavobacteriaceae bacterium]|nr:DUF5929 domain-containing protein [Flavobacteriaceae bacterium]